jgi:hypothetical protein
MVMIDPTIRDIESLISVVLFGCSVVSTWWSRVERYHATDESCW